MASVLSGRSWAPIRPFFFSFSTRSFASSSSSSTKKTSKSKSKAASSSSVPVRAVLYGTPVDPKKAQKVLAVFPDSKKLTQDFFHKAEMTPSRRLSVSPYAALKGKLTSGWDAQVRLPSVSLITACTQTPESMRRLYRWQRKMIKQLGGVDEFKAWSKERMMIGQQFHKVVEEYVKKAPGDRQPPQLADKAKEVGGYWASIEPMLGDVTECVKSEQALTHHRLCYQGRLDAIVKHKDRLLLVDWKTGSSGSSKSRATAVADLYDDPVQLAAYVGAVNADQNVFGKDYNKKKQLVTSAAVVVANEDGTEGRWMELSANELAEYWEKWTRRLYAFWKGLDGLNVEDDADFVYEDEDEEDEGGTDQRGVDSAAFARAREAAAKEGEETAEKAAEMAGEEDANKPKEAAASSTGD